MVAFDVVYLTYRSQKWIDGCFDALLSAQYDLKRLNLFAVDNHSDDKTVNVLKAKQEEYGGRFGAFVVKSNEENLGFGAGNNVGAALGHAPYLFFCNIDTAVYEDTFQALSDAIESDAGTDIAVWELRQFPYEHPKCYNPLTGETSWSSGAAFVIRRDVFEQINGFDERFFMYAEDVDLSWRVRMAGYRLRYVPKAVINHYCYQTAGEIKPIQYVNSIVGNLVLRTKFGSLKERLWGHVCVLRSCLRANVPFDGVGKQIFMAYCASLNKLYSARRWRRKNRKRIDAETFVFHELDYEFRRKGDFWTCSRPKDFPLVSVIVRTCGRPDVLRETLISLCNQTYPNIEVVVVEDGKDASQEMIISEFSDLRIQYHATKEKRGRCVVGNIGMESANGEYFNFLDDDDVFYADHVETLVAALQNNTEFRVAYALGAQTPIRVISQEPYQYELIGYEHAVDFPFNRLRLLQQNYLPIQSVMFARCLYEEYGGFDTHLNVLEDWELWTRYAVKEKFLYIPKTTSQYRVPFCSGQSDERQKKLDAAYAEVRQKISKRVYQWTAEEISREYEMCVQAEFRTSYENRGPAYRVLRKAYRLLKGIARRFLH